MSLNRKWEKLNDPEYRAAYAAAQVNVGIPFQVRALREQFECSQSELAERAGMLQPRISAIEKAGRGSLNIDTLQRIAAAFDVGLMVKFVPFSELVGWEDSFDPENFSVPPFGEDSAPSESPAASLLEGVIQRTEQQRVHGIQTTNVVEIDKARKGPGMEVPAFINSEVVLQYVR